MPRIKLDTRSKTLLMTMGVVALLTTIFITLLLRLHHARIDQGIEQFQHTLRQVAELDTQRQLEFFANRARANLASPGIIAALRDKNHEDLYQLSKGRFAVLQQEIPDLGVMHFHAPDGTSLLRMHFPDNWGDRIADTRPLLAHVHASHTETRGMELGRFGLFLRSIVPAFDGKTYIGALEFGVSPNVILKRVREATGADALLLIDPQAASRLSTDLAPATLTCRGLGLRLCLDDTAIDLPADYQPTPTPQQIVLNDHPYVLHSQIEYTDGQGHRIATLVVAQDIAPLLSGFRQTVLVIISASLFALVGFFLFIRHSLGRMERELSAGHARMHAIANSMSEGLYMLDPQGRLAFVNPAALEMLGYQDSDLIGKNIHALIHHTDRHGQHVSDENCPINQAIHNKKACFRDDDIFWRKDGTPMDVAYAASPVLSDGEIIGSVAVFHDNEKRMAREEALKRELRLFQNGPVVIFTWRNAADWPVDFVSPSIVQWGYSPDDFRSGRVSYADIIHPEDIGRVVARVSNMAASGVSSFEDQYRIRDKQGKWRWTHDFTSIRRDLDGNATHFDGYMYEVSALKEAQLEADELNTQLQGKIQEITRLSETDALTGIANRAHFNRTMQSELARISRYGGKLGLVLLDIDHFKNINDTYGHLVGDRVLQGLSGLIARHLRSSDHFARWGGEEFVILCPGGMDEATLLALKLREQVENHTFPEIERLSCSFGVTDCEPKDSSDSCLSRADQALYQAKEEGRNRVAIQPVNTKKTSVQT